MARLVHGRDASTALESGLLAVAISNRPRRSFVLNPGRAGQPGRSAYTRRLSLWPRRTGSSMENRGRGRLRGVAVLAALAAVAVTAAVWTGSSAASSKADAQPVRALREHHAQRVVGRQPGSRARARHQGARSLVLEEVPERHDQAQVLQLHELHQDHQALAQQQQRARCGGGQPGLPASTPRWSRRS